MVLSGLLTGLAALGLAASPPAAGETAPGETIVLHSDRLERAEALREEFAVDDRTCPNYAGSVTLVLPVTRDGSLYAYAFVTPRLCLARGVSEFNVTSQMHFVVDGMVRAAHRTPFTFNPEQQLDRDETVAAMLSAAREIVGEARVEELRLLGNDVRVLR
jgi:hypothetical protein